MTQRIPSPSPLAGEGRGEGAGPPSLSPISLLLLVLLASLSLCAGINTAAAQPLDLTQGGPITVTARDGLEWHQAQQEVIALGDARAVRENVTVTADRLIAYYRKKAQPDAPTAGANAGAPAPGATMAQPVAAQSSAAQSGVASDADTSGTEIYRLRAEGHVQIFTATDHAQGDLAVYDIDQAVLVMTGHDLRLTTPNDVLTSRDTMEYWPQKHMAVARGNAVVVTKDARRVAADVLVAYTTDTSAPGGAPGGAPGAAPGAARGVAPAKATPPPKTTTAAGSPGSTDDLAASGKLEKVDAYGHVSVRTPTDTAIGDVAVYVPDSGIARLAGHVRITRGQNQLDGQEAEVNMKTGIARLLRGNAARVTGLVVPNDATNRGLQNLAPPDATATPAGGASAGGTPAGTPAAKSTGNPTANSTSKPTGGHQ